MTFSGNFFPRWVEDIIFMWRATHKMRLSPHKVRLNIKTNFEMSFPGGGSMEKRSGGQSGRQGLRSREPEWGMWGNRTRVGDRGQWEQGPE